MTSQQPRSSTQDPPALPESDYVEDGGLRELLEDFEVVGNGAYAVLTARHSHLKEFQNNIRAVIVAETLNLASIDYARRRYCNKSPDDAGRDDRLDEYLAAYQASKAYIERIFAKLRTENRPEPKAGTFSASLVLERLRSSFFSAHFLYRMGHRYEGHAVARLILEQVAWAYAAHKLEDIEALKKVRATEAVTELKKFVPEAGPLYGLLSKETHIGFKHHPSFITIEAGRGAIWFAQAQFLEYGRVILQLADMVGIAWELSQASYIDSPESIELMSGKWRPKPDRPFRQEMQRRIAALEVALAKQANSSLRKTRRGRRAS